MLEGLTAVHDGALPYVGAYKSTPPEGGYPRHEHPVVTVHPETGRKLLYVNSNFTTRIEGLTDAESDALLQLLLEHVRSPELQVRFCWEPDSVAIWDNRCTQHYAVADYRERRVMHRVTLAGDRPY